MLFYYQTEWKTLKLAVKYVKKSIHGIYHLKRWLLPKVYIQMKMATKTQYPGVNGMASFITTDKQLQKLRLCFLRT